MSFDIREIKKQFDEVIRYSQGIENPKTEELFNRFLDAKRDFIELFGGNLIYEYPYVLHLKLDKKEKQKNLNNFLDTIDCLYSNYDLINFIEINRDGFFTNQVIEEYKLPDGKIIPVGMKLVKAFKYFISDKDLLNDIQNSASRVIQEDKIEGKLCISVHPLDFLSSSENTYNWRSCHALDGEYRAGNLSYMVDKSTVICYLKGADGVRLPNFPEDVLWNSKKWRVLIFFEKNWRAIFAGRQYPLSTLSALETISMCLNNMGIEFHRWEDSNITGYTDKISGKQYPLDTDYIAIGGKIYPIRDKVVDAKNSLQFDDLINSSCYRPYIAVRARGFYASDADEWHWDIGGEINCLNCGKSLIEHSDFMRCDSCELAYGDSENDIFGYCDCCGRRILLDEAYYVDSDEIVCSDCFKNECMTCDRCGNGYYRSSMKYNEEYHKYLCPWCSEDMERGEPFDLKQLVFDECNKLEKKIMEDNNGEGTNC